MHRDSPSHVQFFFAAADRIASSPKETNSAIRASIQINSMIAQAMKAHQDAVIRLAEVPGLGVGSAQQIHLSRIAAFES